MIVESIVDDHVCYEEGERRLALETRELVHHHPDAQGSGQWNYLKHW